MKEITWEILSIVSLARALYEAKASYKVPNEVPKSRLGYAAEGLER